MSFIENKKNEFVVLTPVGSADPDGVYARAISFALDSDDVKNIAITGPYGSGKSSVIKTFEEKNKEKYSFLNVSLASFKNDNEVMPNNNEEEYERKDDGELSDSSVRLIERSILQQLLYGVDADKLPYSRFKRISVPKNPLIKSLIFIFWIICSFVIIFHRENFIYGLVDPAYQYYFLSILVFFLSLPVVLISDIHKSSFSLSFKKISLANAEIETENLSEDSILNRHLDEIIYFFQATNKRIVIFEDLDRFCNAEIFVKLREINKLINDNESIGGKVKFIYALKDGMFLHKNRTKFFDFIIPVIPIINSFNSLDLMQKRVANFDVSINEEFIRYVSLYVDDLRLMHNTFNEFAIYSRSLKSENLDPTKLLAIMVYKNVYPSDFEKLHHGDGALFEICNLKKSFIENRKAELNAKLLNFKKDIDNLGTEVVDSVKELIYLYIGYLVACANGKAVGGVSIKGNNVPLSEINSYESFEPLMKEEKIKLYLFDPNFGFRFESLGKTFSQFESEVNDTSTFLSRKLNIEKKASDKKREIIRNINILERDIFNLPKLKLSEALISSNEFIDSVFNKNSIKNKSLIEYLVKNEFIDESYDLYISNFYEGRLTANDREFLISVRNFRGFDASYRIDNPKEVCRNLNEDDFRDKYVLNIYLVDYLVDHDESGVKIKNLLNFISENFSLLEDFFYHYFLGALNLSKFVDTLSHSWAGFGVSAIGFSSASSIIFRLLEDVDGDYIGLHMNEDDQLTSYISENGSLFKEHFKVIKSHETLKILNVKFISLPEIEPSNDFLNYLISENLYKINKENVNYILRYLNFDESNICSSNYTSVIDSKSEQLKNHIDENINSYVENVALSIPENSKETASALINLLDNNKLSNINKSKLISKQEVVFKDINEVPELYWGTLLIEEKVEISWSNILAYIELDNFDDGIISEAIENNVEFILLTKPDSIPNRDDQRKVFDYIFDNKNISFDAYCKLIACFGFWSKTFPDEASQDKKFFLAKNRNIYLNSDSYKDASGDEAIIGFLIRVYPKYYFDDKDKFIISDKVRDFLIRSNIDDEYKIKIYLDFSIDYLKSNVDLAVMMIDIAIHNDSVNVFPGEFIAFLIVTTRDYEESIKLLTIYIAMVKKDEVMRVVSDLNNPYKEIASYGKRPKLINNKTNEDLSFALKRHGCISSFKEYGNIIRINTLRSP